MKELGKNLIFIAVILFLPLQVLAKDEHDLNLLAPISLEVPIYKKLHGVLDVQSVVKDDVSEIGRLLVSPSLQYELTDHIAVQAGYSNIHAFNNGRGEQTHSLFQSVFIHHRAKILPEVKKKFYIGHALTTEQEIYPQGIVARGAYRFQIGKQIFDTPYRFLASNETVANFNSVNGAARSGFDQNRTFVGVGRCFSLHFCTRTGYQLQVINREGSSDKLNHRIFVGAIINLTGPAHMDRFREKR